MVLNTARVLRYRRCQKTTMQCLIVDECHRAASQSNSLALAGDYRATLGMSATPEREHDNFFHRDSGSGLRTYSVRVQLRPGACKMAVIVPFDLVNVSASICRPKSSCDTMKPLRTLFEPTGGVESGEVSREVLAIKLQRRARLAATSLQRIPVTIRLAEQHRGSRLIVFHESIPSADINT